ncbi:MAG: hypothetical protein M3Y76_04625 [Chloroflexota bacterium]|nr:hypothetical protein [Chloroflexota bacterium]
MTNQYTARLQQLIDAVLTTPGDTDVNFRRAVEARAAELGGRAAGMEDQKGEVPAELGKYVRKVAMHAYKVTDSDVEALRKAGYSEDAIFEYTLSAALGASVARLERGLQAVRGER